jgi:hypothetical protein
MFLIIVFLMAIPASEGGYLLNKIYAIFPSFRFSFMIIFVIVATAFAIKIFKTYKVNYLFIFELDPNYKLTHV